MSKLKNRQALIFGCDLICRSSKAGLREVATEEEEKEELKAVKGKCIPRKKFSSKHSKK